jgi:hypothetical protein
MPSPIPHRIHLKRLLPAIVAGLVSSFAFVAFFTSALHDPQPNGLAVAVVASRRRPGRSSTTSTRRSPAGSP